MILFLLSFVGIAPISSEVGIAPVSNSERRRNKNYENKVTGYNNAAFQNINIIEALFRNIKKNDDVFDYVTSAFTTDQNPKFCRNDHAYIRKRSIRRSINRFKSGYV